MGKGLPRFPYNHLMHNILIPNLKYFPDVFQNIGTIDRTLI